MPKKSPFFISKEMSSKIMSEIPLKFKFFIVTTLLLSSFIMDIILYLVHSTIFYKVSKKI